MTNRIRHAIAFARNEDGTVLVAFALTIAALLALVGSALDYGVAYGQARKMQAAVDAAALAAAAGDLPDDERIALAEETYRQNVGRFGGDIAALKVEVDDTLIRVSVTDQTRTGFMSLMGIDHLQVKRSAAAMQVAATNTSPFNKLCILALKEGIGSYEHSGTGTLTARNCGVQVNSSSSQGLMEKGHGQAVADSFCVVGDYSGDGFTPTPQPESASVPDPLEGLPVPDKTCPTSGIGAGGLTVREDMALDPGVYCGGIFIGRGLRVTFNPGLYVIRDGFFSIGANATVEGDGVTFYMTGEPGANQSFTFSSGSNSDLTAPTGGTYAGLLFVHEKGTQTGAYDKITGGGNLNFTGGFYLPDQTLVITGSGWGGGRLVYMPIIAGKIDFGGTGDLEIEADYEATGMPPIYGFTTEAPVTRTMAHLVE